MPFVNHFDEPGKRVRLPCHEEFAIEPVHVALELHEIEPETEGVGAQLLDLCVEHLVAGGEGFQSIGVSLRCGH